MKKILYLCLALVASIFSVSCSSDEPVPDIEETVTFRLNIPKEMQTRASFGDSENQKVTLNQLKWSLYEDLADGSRKYLGDGLSDDAFNNSQDVAEVSLKLMKSRNYTVVFFAHNSSDTFVDFKEGQIDINYSTAAANNPQSDCFVGAIGLSKETDLSLIKLQLERPFVQLNWGAGDIDDKVTAAQANINLQVQIVSGLYKTMDVITGKLSNPVENVTVADLKLNQRPEGVDFPVPNTTYLIMNYLLTGNGTIDAQLTIKNTATEAAEGTLTLPVEKTTVKPNYRVNLYGDFFTKNTDFYNTL